METVVADPELAGVLHRLDADLTALLSVGPEPVDARDAIPVIAEIERLSHRLDAAKVAAMNSIATRGLHVADGHASAKVMVRHVARLAPSSAARRSRAARMLRDLPEVKAAFQAGTIGSDQIDVIAKIHANPRIRSRTRARVDWFLKKAQSMSAADFERKAREWERLADQDGPRPSAQRGHEQRNATLLQDHFDLGWHLKANFGSLHGAAMQSIFDFYASAERLTDWEAARTLHGADATETDLPRSEAQRRADALLQIFVDAANNPEGSVPLSFHHVIAWSPDTHAAVLRSFETGNNPIFDPALLDNDGYRCETIDGTPIDPLEAGMSSLVDPVRRALLDANSVTIDLGEARRFTGHARLAAQLHHHHCLWPGCTVPTSQSQIDHIHNHANGGDTNPENGIPFCGRHNRLKQKGFSTYRDPNGTWHIQRPDGTELT